ncbi:MAG: lysylphosphatidylglycerol synthase transmembrane domain-containing protein [Dehalococcoidales bacterium]|nr:lysylphosphatidylglycerol synthase transmembrane domain-containing protein [Dehalococcoidales bacterium]
MEVGNGEERTTDVSLERRFFNWNTLLSFLVAFGILYFVITKIDVDFGQIIDRIRTADPFYYLLGLLIYYASFVVRAWRWGFLLKNVGFRSRDGVHVPSLSGLTEIILISWFVNCITPARLGDAYRGYMLKSRTGASFSKTLGTILAERIIDLLVLLVLLGLAGLRVFHGTVPETFGSMLVAGGALVVVIAVGLFVMIRFGRTVQRLLPARFKGLYDRFEEGTLLSFQNLPLLGSLTMVIWATETGRLWFIFNSLGVQSFSLSVVIFVALAASLLTTIPMTPAGLGVVESALIGLLLLLNNVSAVRGVDQVSAASIAVLDRTISYWSLVLVGLLVYLFTRRKEIGEGLRRLYCASASITRRQ